MEVIQVEKQIPQVSPEENELCIRDNEEICRRQYQILQNVDAQDKDNSITKKKAIQILAKSMEEIMRRRGQEYGIPDICSIICDNLSKLGMTKDMYRYPIYCLDTKYKRRVNHSVQQQVVDNTDRIEHSSLYADEVKRAFTLIESLDYEGLQRSDIQDFAERANKLPKKIYDECDKRNIAYFREDKDYKSPEDKYKDPIRYPKTKPARTILVEAIEDHMDAWEHVRDRVYTEGADPVTERLYQTDEVLLECADGLNQMTVLLKPLTDRKYRKTWLQWYYIVKEAHAWFKHSAARKFEVEDFEKFMRSLTREQIGFRMSKEGSVTFDKVVRFFPGYFKIYVLHYPQVSERLGAQFSRLLHPKLSDRSIS